MVEGNTEDTGLLSSSSALTNMIRKSRSNLRLDSEEVGQTQEGSEEPEGQSEIATDQLDGLADEQTPLLSKPSQPANDSLEQNQTHDVERQAGRLKKRTKFKQLLSEAQDRTGNAWQVLKNPKGWDRKVVFQKVIKDPVGLLPCVFLGVLLNVLDALSYGKLLLIISAVYANIIKA